jgi:hypothetical protein
VHHRVKPTGKIAEFGLPPPLPLTPAPAPTVRSYGETWGNVGQRPGQRPRNFDQYLKVSAESAIHRPIFQRGFRSAQIAIQGQGRPEANAVDLYFLADEPDHGGLILFYARIAPDSGIGEKIVVEVVIGGGYLADDAFV